MNGRTVAADSSSDEPHMTAQEQGRAGKEDAQPAGPASPSEVDDDSLLGAIGGDAAVFAQIDSTLDLLVHTIDLADVPPVDWDLSS